MSLNLFIILIAIIGILSITVWLGGGALWRKFRENETLKYEFITIIAHKFRTPLTQMKWLVEGLIADEQDSYKKEGLTEIQHSNQKLIDLTATLIELTDSADKSHSSYTFEPFNLCELVRNVSDSFKNTFHEKNLFLSFQSSLPEIWSDIDRSRMEFVLQTLLQNAATYSPPGRNVDVTVTTEKKKALIIVKDNGIGIAPHDLPKIFTKFFRTEVAQKTDTDGFGVGLYLAQSIVKRHKGSIGVYSEGLDRGTTFQITLPLGQRKT